MFAENDPEDEHVPAIRQNSPTPFIPATYNDDLPVLSSMDGTTVVSPTVSPIPPTSPDSVELGDPDEIVVVEDDPFPGSSHEGKAYISDL